MAEAKDIIITPENPFEIKCDVCGGESREYVCITKDIKLTEVRERITFKPIGYVKRIVLRYVGAILRTPITSETFMCQGCVSKSFRGFTKGL